MNKDKARRELYRRLGYREDYDEKNRVVAQDNIEYKGKTYRVSTVDLGLDHGFGGSKPLYWETMIFEDNSWHDLYMERYSSRTDAKNRHEEILKHFRKGNVIIDGDFLEIPKDKSSLSIEELENEINK